MQSSHYDYNNCVHVFGNGYIGYHCQIKNKFVVLKESDERVVCGHIFHTKCKPGQTKCPVCLQILN